MKEKSGSRHDDTAGARLLREALMAPGVSIFGIGGIGAVYACLLSRAVLASSMCRRIRPVVVRAEGGAAAVDPNALFDYVLVCSEVLPAVPSTAELIKPAVSSKATFHQIKNSPSGKEGQVAIRRSLGPNRTAAGVKRVRNSPRSQGRAANPPMQASERRRRYAGDTEKRAEIKPELKQTPLSESKAESSEIPAGKERGAPRGQSCPWGLAQVKTGGGMPPRKGERKMAPRKIKPKAGAGIEGAGDDEAEEERLATELAERDAVVRDGEDEERSEDREEGKHFGGDEQDDTDRALSRAGGDPDGWFLLARAR
ncbi:hypothetical protein JHW43_003215 [Diplocarpon mali]|nr:hypothetical protein JHW43_003215 [Diplocarpon mali]